jgi:hypothetical protein
VLANFFFVVTVPSWLNEKAPGVSVGGALGVSVGASTALYLILGIVGAMAPVSWASTDLISTLVYSTNPRVWLAAKIAAFVLPLSTLLTSIPVFR